MVKKSDLKVMGYGDLVDVCNANEVEVKDEDDKESLLKKLKSVKDLADLDEE